MNTEKFKKSIDEMEECNNIMLDAYKDSKEPNGKEKYDYFRGVKSTLDIVKVMIEEE